MKTVDPITAQLPAILAAIPQDTPLTMLNLLRFRDTAQYDSDSQADDTSPCSGRDAYARYAEVAMRKVIEVGGHPIYVGRVASQIIAPTDEIWHEIFLIRYPSLAAFTRMLAMPDYHAATRHRTAALDDTRLIVTVERKLV
jgi:uncharacterized protein (DUF1330 family)